MHDHHDPCAVNSLVETLGSSPVEGRVVRDPAHGLYPGQSDWGFRFIQLLERLGFAWDVRTPEGMIARTFQLETIE